MIYMNSIYLRQLIFITQFGPDHDFLQNPLHGSHSRTQDEIWMPYLGYIKIMALQGGCI